MLLSKIRLKKIYRVIGHVLCLGCVAFALSGCGQGNGASVKEGQDVIEVPEDDSIDIDSTAADNIGSASDAGNDGNVSDTDNADSAGNYYVDGSDITYAELSEGDGAPNFEAELKGGEKFVLSDNVGKVVLINLWATWCGPCVGEMPAFERLNNEYGDDVKIVCVNCVEDKNTVDDFIDSNGFTFPVAYDENAEINNRYPTQGIPYTVVIGKNGIIRNIYLGSEGEEEQYQKYKAAIDAALAE